MSIDSCRRQAQQIQETITRLQQQKAKESSKAATASMKSLDAKAAAGRTKTLSTIKLKLNEAQRYANDEAKAQKEMGKLEEKIGAEQKKLIAAQKRLGQEEDREHKKKVAEQKRMAQAHERQMKEINSGLTRHERLHTETAAQIEMLRALPEEIVVAFFATDPAKDSGSRLLLDEEVRSIQQKIRLSDHRDSVKLESRWALRPGDILQHLNELKPTVVHFSGHGSEQDELVLQDDLGNAKFVAVEGLAKAFALFADSVRLVFFNTCSSYNQALACSEHIQAAIGMNTSIGDEAARIFSAQFYSAIGFGHSIRAAFDQAKAALLLEGIPEDSTPEIYFKDGVNEEDLVLVKPKA
ncbi:hypothetical protein [Pseudomonas sp. B392_1p]|uniref:hypothetical protein n=1 Tax=Pseudomonas sp. B392_1p TaxID=3457507 RepID=UPI003FD052B8